MLKNEIIAIALLLVLSVGTLHGYSVEISGSTESISILEDLEILPEAGHSFSIENVQSQSFLQHADWVDRLQSNEVYWGRVRIKNGTFESASNPVWVIEFPRVLTDVEVFLLDEQGNWEESRTGQFVPLKNRTFAPVLKTNIIQVNISNGNAATLYFRAKCERVRAIPKFNLNLYSSNFYFNTLKNKRFNQGLFIGFMLMMLTYNLFLYFFADQDKAYLNYSMYILGIVLYSAYNSGDLAYFTNSLFLPDLPKYSYLGKTSTYLVILGYLYFLRNFLNLKQLLPKWNKLLQRVLWINAIAFIADVILMLTTNFNADIADFVTVGNAMVFILFIFSFGISLFQVKNGNAYFIISGIALMGLGSILTIVARINGLDYSTAPFQIGTIFEVIIFSLGLASRRRRIVEEKQEAFFDLQKTELLRSQERKETQRLKGLDLLKSQLYTNITHEFRTPLMIINGNLDYIEGFDQEKSIIKRNSDQLLRLINQVLDLSKMESDLLEVNLFQGDIVAYLQYITESFHSMAVAKNIRLTFYSEEKVIMMDFDKEKIEHIAYNLISNALKFTSSGGKIILHLKKINNDAQPMLMLKVKDSGCGIAADRLPLVFDRYHKLNNSDNIGTGIGLAFVKEIVALLKGEITVNSEVNVGSEFNVMLPITNQHEYADLSQTKIPAVDIPLLDEAEQEKKVGELLPILLLIEDNCDVSEYIRKMLNSKYQMHLAYDGEEGYKKALELVPDIIICDVMMPRMDGYQVTSQLKGNQKTSHIPIILLTAKATQADKNDGLLSGADTFLMKPFNKEELFIRLSNLDRQRKVLIEKFRTEFFNTSKSSDNQSPVAKENSFLQAVREELMAHLSDSEYGVKEICQKLNLSKNQFYRKIKALTGQSPTLFIHDIRLNEALQLLKNTDLNVSEIAYRVGFSDPNYFTRLFQRKYGKAPSQFVR